jgi:hypothetical protein
MVESQRDLLLRTVHELQQRSNPQSNTSPDVNRVLQELNVRLGDSEDTYCSQLQDSSELQTSPGAITTSDNNSDVPGLDSTALEKLPWVNITSMGTSSPIIAANPEADPKNYIPEKAMETGELVSEYLQEEPFDTYHFSDNILPTQWASASSDPYLGYGSNSVVGSFTDVDGLQQQMWQIDDMEFLNKQVMQDVL